MGSRGAVCWTDMGRVAQDSGSLDFILGAMGTATISPFWGLARRGEGRYYDFSSQRGGLHPPGWSGSQRMEAPGSLANLGMCQRDSSHHCPAPAQSLEGPGPEPARHLDLREASGRHLSLHEALGRHLSLREALGLPKPRGQRAKDQPPSHWLLGRAGYGPPFLLRGGGGGCQLTPGASAP